MSQPSQSPFRSIALSSLFVAGCGIALVAAGRPALDVAIGLVLGAGVCMGVALRLGRVAQVDDSWRARMTESLGTAPLEADVALRLKYTEPDEATAILGAQLAALDESSRRERTRILNLLDSVGEPVLATDQSGAIVLVNAAAASFFQGRGLGLVGRRVEDVFTQLEVVELHRRASRGNPVTAQVRLVREGVPRQFEVAATPWRTDQSPEGTPGQSVVLTLRDVTEMATAAQLKTDFVASASHELRTPLAAIKGAIETLQWGADEDPAMRARFIRMIGTSAARLEELTRDLLDLSRLESPDAVVSPSMVSAGPFVLNITDQFGLECSAREISMEVEVAPACASIRTDPRLLELVVRNLVENAVKFAAPATPVRVTIAPGPVAGSVRCQVTDHGIGIPLDQQQRIFERFYQVDPSRQGNGPKGTGLGLAIVKYAVRALGGVVKVDSVWGQGTTMTVDLPDAIRKE